MSHRMTEVFERSLGMQSDIDLNISMKTNVLVYRRGECSRPKTQGIRGNPLSGSEVQKRRRRCCIDPYLINYVLTGWLY